MIPLAVAVIVVVPLAALVMIPVLAVMGIFGFEEVHVALTVCPELSCARNVRVEPTDAENEVPEVEVQPAVHEIVRLPPPPVVTVRVVLPLCPLWLAVMVVVPVLMALARPELLIVATVASEEPQLADDEMSLLVPSPKLPIAVNCCVLVNCKEAFEGVTEMATKLFASGKNFPQLTANAAKRSNDTSVQRCVLNDARLERLLLDGPFDMRCTASSAIERSFPH